MKQVLLLAAMAFVVGGCGIGKEVYEGKVGELNKTKAQLDQETRDAADAKRKCDERQAQLDAENSGLKHKLDQAHIDYSNLASTSEEDKKRIAELQKQQAAAEKRAAQFREMMNKFRSMIDAGKLQVEIRNGLMLVKLPDNILFDPGKTETKQAGKDAIAQVTQILSGIEGRKFQVTGHTDNIPIKSAKFKSNWELSTARAVEVTKLMTADGMDPKRLSAAGYADELPVGDNATEEGRRANRRIEIVVQPNIEDLPSMEDTGAKPTT